MNARLRLWLGAHPGDHIGVEWPTRATRALVAIPICVLAVLGWWAFRDRDYVLVDDAYIAFRYAANFADGSGLVWNPGERVEGYTNPLWVILMSGFAKLGVDLVLPGILSSLAFAAACVAIVVHLGRRIPGAGPLAALLPGLLLATNPSFDHASTSAMESTAFAFLALLGIHLLIRSREHTRSAAGAALCFCAAYLTRPEGALVAAIALGVEALARSGPLRDRVRALAPIAFAVALVIAAHVAARVAYYGYPLPNTYYAKVILGRIAAVRGAAHVGGFLLAGGWLALPGVLEVERPSPLRPWFVHGYALLVAYTTYIVVVGGDHPFWYRFYVPLMPLPLLATSQLAVRVAGRIADASLRWAGRALRTTFAVVSALAFVVLPRWLAYPFSERAEVIGHLEPGFRDIVTNIARFFRDEAPAGSLVAALPVGHLGYYARNIRILDMWGLNDVHIAHLDVPPLFKSGHDKYDPGYVILTKPDYAYMFRFDVPAPMPVPGYDICWPTKYFPFVIYRRNFPLAPAERELGVPHDHPRYLAPPPACRPPP
ncbi:MAG TPA: hypothetical protein VHC69_28155 [Polyangiaceae bacterium]|nr:hypothetical protein [Polyangiaceae bacterium]